MDTEIEMVDIEMEHRMIRDKAHAFFLGELDDNDREVWVWLPISQIEIIAEEKSEGDCCTVRVPLWIAKNKGLV